MKHIVIRIIILLIVATFVLGVIVSLFSLIGQSFTSAVQWVGRWGDVEILTDDAIVTQPSVRTESPGTTVPPGDDPSWKLEMPQAPVDMTADELAQDQ